MDPRFVTTTYHYRIISEHSSSTTETQHYFRALRLVARKQLASPPGPRRLCWSSHREEGCQCAGDENRGENRETNGFLCFFFSHDMKPKGWFLFFFGTPMKWDRLSSFLGEFVLEIVRWCGESEWPFFPNTVGSMASWKNQRPMLSCQCMKRMFQQIIYCIKIHTHDRSQHGISWLHGSFHVFSHHFFSNVFLTGQFVASYRSCRADAGLQRRGWQVGCDESITWSLVNWLILIV